MSRSHHGGAAVVLAGLALIVAVIGSSNADAGSQSRISTLVRERESGIASFEVGEVAKCRRGEKVVGGGVVAHEDTGAEATIIQYQPFTKGGCNHPRGW